jgi:hypothetical protein
MGLKVEKIFKSDDIKPSILLIGRAIDLYSKRHEFSGNGCTG